MTYGELEAARFVFWNDRLSRLSSGVLREGLEAARSFRLVFLEGYWLGFLKLGGM